MPMQDVGFHETVQLVSGEHVADPTHVGECHLDP